MAEREREREKEREIEREKEREERTRERQGKRGCIKKPHARSMPPKHNDEMYLFYRKGYGRRTAIRI